MKTQKIIGWIKTIQLVYLTFERFGKAKGDWKQSKLGEDNWSNNLAPLHRSFFWGYRLEEEK